MTREELGRVPFKCVSSLAMEDEHCLTYINEEYNFGMCQHTKKKADGFSFGRTYTHYEIPALKAHSFRGGMKMQTDISR